MPPRWLSEPGRLGILIDCSSDTYPIGGPSATMLFQELLIYPQLIQRWHQPYMVEIWIISVSAISTPMAAFEVWWQVQYIHWYMITGTALLYYT